MSIRDQLAGRPAMLIGFSLGAKIAMQVAAVLGPQVLSLHLVSSAGPLDVGLDLKRVAGAALFRLAERRQVAFTAATRSQALIAAIAPGLLARAMFASSPPADKELLHRPTFRVMLAASLRRAFANGGAGYRREITGYVRPWHDVLGRIEQPVTLWHGALDSWAPIEMGAQLGDRLPNTIAFHRLPNLGHYSTLEFALKRLSRMAP